MTFFNWQPDEGEQILSSYFWLYPVVALSLMIPTGLVLYRPKAKLMVRLRRIFIRLSEEDSMQSMEKGQLPV
jgi:hypothetical protein